MNTNLNGCSNFAILIGILLLLNTSTSGQTNFDLEVETRTGYEYNVFNVHPDKKIMLDGVTVDALKSGYFQNARIKAALSRKSKYHLLRMKGEIQKYYFLDIENANLFRPSVMAKYRLSPSKRHNFSLTGRYQRYQTNRPENEEEVLRPPPAYDRTQATVKYQMKLLTGNKSTFQSSLRRNNYVTNEEREFYYNAWNTRLSINQRFYKNKKHSHALSLEGIYEVRNYHDYEFEEVTEEESLEERVWKYYTIDGVYSWKVKKYLKMKVGLKVTERKDLLQNRFGYRQYQPHFNISFKKKKIEFAVRVSAVRRIYHTLKARSDIDIRLLHTFLRGSLSLKWKISKKINVSLKSRGVRRIRNYPENATKFLAYDNAILSLGVIYHPF